MARNKASENGDSPRMTPKRAKNVVGVAKVIGPAVAPYALQAVGQLRERYDRYRARKLGVEPEDMAKFSGRGGALQARITGDLRACQDLAERHASSEADRQFATGSQERLQSLLAAVRAAERMPTTRRRAAFHAIDADLDVLEKELLQRLGVSQAR